VGLQTTALNTMKKLNKKSAEVFNKILKLLGTQEALKIDNNPSFMYLCIDRLMTDVEILKGVKFDVYSLAHYYEQNGDLVCDPDMEFAVCKSDPMFIYPMSFQNSIACRQSIVEVDGVWKVNVREQADEAVFANLWLENIKHQQGL